MLLASVFALVLADITVTQRIYAQSCTDTPLRTIGPTTVPFVSCSAYSAALDCPIGQCCSVRITSFLRGYTMYECTENGGGSLIDTVCSTLSDAALSACRLDNSTCVSTSPSNLCCGALFAWTTGCSDTTAISPGGLECAYRPTDAEAYYSDRCDLAGDLCTTIEPVIRGLCTDSAGCAAARPSTECCSALSGTDLVGSSCIYSAADCPAEIVTEALIQKCNEVFTPSVSRSPSPSPAADQRKVASCTLFWREDMCAGTPAMQCAEQPGFASCQDYNRYQMAAYHTATQQREISCNPETCCELYDGTSYLWTCEDSAVASSGTFAILLALLTAFVSRLF